ncbi:MAG: hypothetical protein KGH57_01240 [Candidatus Micrarchaeota archaeon]|nr:hypothetical protein [Candidatus Micrarchaeota archaeon]
MQALLERGEKAELAISLRRALRYTGDLVESDVEHYKIRFEPMVVMEGQERGQLIDPNTQEILVNSRVYKSLIENSKNVPNRFASYLLVYGISRALTKELIATSGELSVNEVISFMQSTKKEENPVRLMVDATEGPAIAYGLLKIASLIVLHDENSEGKKWRRFAKPYLETLLSVDSENVIKAETDARLRYIDTWVEVQRAAENLKQGGNFGEYTLRFLDSLNGRTKAPDLQSVLLGDIFASAYLQTFTKTELKWEIGMFFSDQQCKTKALNLSTEWPSMIGMFSEHKAQFNKISEAIRNSRRLPPVASDVAKEWSEN